MGSPGYIAPSQLAAQKPGVSGPSNISPMPTMRDNFAQPVAPAAPQMSPLSQQIIQRSMAPQPIMGLPAALMQMRGQLNQPMMRAPMPQYGTQGNPLGYRPNMAPAMEALNRVKPSVYKTELDLARERIAQYEAAEEARKQQEQNNNYWAFNQG
jgi:hypothetical protein